MLSHVFNTMVNVHCSFNLVDSNCNPNSGLEYPAQGLDALPCYLEKRKVIPLSLGSTQ